MSIKKTLLDLISDIENKKTTSDNLVKESFSLAYKFRDKYNLFNLILDKETKIKNKAPFYGIPYTLKDNISTKNIKTTSSSKILENYIPLFDATIYKKLKENNATMIAKTNLDELAMGGGGISGFNGPILNPHSPNEKRFTGGSSAGSVASVALGITPFSIGSDTGDSVRKPASYCGVVGFKPTYGKISRYGLFPFAPSMDHLGFFTRSVKDCAFLLTHLQGEDDYDTTVSKKREENYIKEYNLNVKQKKVAVIKELIDSIEDKKVIEEFNKSVQILKDAGVIVDYISFDLDLLKAIYPTYIVISSCEATSNNANLDGIKFGLQEEGKDYQEIMLNTRTKGFGPLIKRRFILGAYALHKENQKEIYLRAKKVRRRIVEETNKILNKYDAIYSMSAGNVAPLINEKIEELEPVCEHYLTIANFAGLPSLSVPIGKKNNLPLGASFTCRAFDEKTLFSLSGFLESKLPYKNMIAKGEDKNEL